MLLLTGATGYVGGRLLRRLERDKFSVRCLCRDPEALRGRVAPGTGLVRGDLLQSASLAAAFSGVDTAFYLVHSMHAGPEFEAQEREAAANFAQAAREAGVRRIIYLGGLAHGGELSSHMRSRAATGNILRSSGIDVLEFQASIVIGSGSASFEMIRALVERLPVMITPRWVNTGAQPIAIEDVIEYLASAIRLPLQGNVTVEIGGSDITSYVGIMREFARQRKLRRWILRVPFLSLSLSSRWLTLITPVYASIGRALIESVRNPSVVLDPRARELFTVRPMGIRRAIERALANEDRPAAESRWSDARARAGGRGVAPEAGRDLLINEQTTRVPLTPEQAFAPIRRIGGLTGWYFGNVLWRIRGLIDLITGGVGMRRGRPDPETPLPGSTLDFWRVEL
ncbi:MAG: SDR family oxidoreductase, partial [Acidobacteria bacterium]|nr:SDR family oxidoreductase [Acidobacteriota bacterium]